MSLKILYVYRTKRKQVLNQWQTGSAPDSQLFGFNHLRKRGLNVSFFDFAYSPLNPWHWLFYPFEHAIIGELGMGFKLDQAVTLLPIIKRFDALVCTTDSIGLPFLWLKHLGLIKKPIIFLGGATAGVLRDNFDSWVVSFYKRFIAAADIMTCYAKVEVDFFANKMAVPRNKIRYIPYGTDWEFFAKPSKLKRTIVAAGGIDASRDYATFFDAVKDLDIKAEVACHPKNIEGLTAPKNVKVRLLIDILEMRNMFRRAKVMVVPMKEINRSSGQMVVLEAASAGCAVVVSQVKGITGAFKLKNKEHVCFVRPGDAVGLRKIIQYLLDHPREAAAMGKRASKFMKQNYTSKHLADHVDNFIKELIDCQVRILFAID